MTRLRSPRLLLCGLTALATLCMGGTCRDETFQTVGTTFLNELAAALASAVVSAVGSR